MIHKLFALTIVAILVASLLVGVSRAGSGGTKTEAAAGQPATTYPVADSGQVSCYDNGQEVACPAEGQAFYGQDAQHSGQPPSYTDHGDGTVTDNVTGVMWQQSPDTDGDGDIDAADKLTYALGGLA